MKEINKRDMVVITNLLEPLYEVFEDVVASKEGDSPAEHQAWLDWATEFVSLRLGWPEDMARREIIKLEKSYKSGGY